MPIEVVNRYHGHEPDGQNNIAIYRGKPLGNPYRIGDYSTFLKKTVTREDAIEAYKIWFDYQVQLGNISVQAALDEIAHKHLDGHEVKLICYCKPKHCHGDIIKQFIEDRLKEMGYG